jgi:alpha-ketoglutarate-dependent taurine dioxygenase
MQPWTSIDRTAGYETIGVKPLNGAVGAEIVGLDIARPLTAQQADEVRRALSENLVIFFREQQGFGREEHMAFARTFGPYQRIPHIFSVDGYPEVQVVERTKDDSRRVVGEGYHNDSTFMDTPPTSVTMHAIDVPDFGGDTAFANMYLAYETLSPKMQAWLATLQGVNSAKQLFGSGVDQSRVMMKNMDTEQGDREVLHPLVVTHHHSGRKHLFFNYIYTRRIDGLSDAESRNLIDFLRTHCAQIAFTGRVSYANGTVLVWDNWAAHHSAVADYQGKYRYMERVTTGGIRPT